jgi:pyruvate/2-oxoglutarate dehydrogenase complex dihydrolipoamide dehydrogenase (E3) component
MLDYDVVVVGKGNAALCAALSAHEQGAKVAMLEAACEDESGGNSRFAGGVSAELWGRHFYAGDKLKTEITLINDDESFTDLETPKVLCQLVEGTRDRCRPCGWRAPDTC